MQCSFVTRPKSLHLTLTYERRGVSYQTETTAKIKTHTEKDKTEASVDKHSLEISTQQALR